MKKVLLILSILLIPTMGQAFTVDEVINHEAPSAYFYKQEFDKLVLDVVIPGPDKLSAITIKNNGNAKNRYDITKFVLWSDAGEEGFQGMGKDKIIADFEYYSDSVYWYLSDLDLNIPEQGLRIFISAEIAKGATGGRYIKIGIPKLDDIDGDGSFDIGDFGVFTESQNNGPEDGVIMNSSSQSLRAFVGRDNIAPVSVIDDIKTITTESYTITGQSRDQGGSTSAWVRISINDTWYDVVDTNANYSTWEYQWNDIEEGAYTIKTQSADWLGNTETEGDNITVLVDFPNPNPDPDPDPDPDYVPDPELTLEEQLMAQIKDIQEQIIELLNQLVQIYLEELASL